MERIINLTPHRLDVHVPIETHGHPILRFESAGIARLVETRTESTGVAGVPTTLVRHNHVEGLPDPQPGVTYIVSAMVAKHLRRADVLSPGPLVRNSEGQVIGCNGLTRWTPPRGPGATLVDHMRRHSNVAASYTR